MHFARDNCTSAGIRSSFALPEETRLLFFNDERRHFTRYLYLFPLVVSLLPPRQQAVLEVVIEAKAKGSEGIPRRKEITQKKEL
jgi:hypothetical protein